MQYRICSFYLFSVCLPQTCVLSQPIKIKEYYLNLIYLLRHMVQHVYFTIGQSPSFSTLALGSQKHVKCLAHDTIGYDGCS